MKYNDVVQDTLFVIDAFTDILDRMKSDEKTKFNFTEDRLIFSGSINGIEYLTKEFKYADADSVEAFLNMVRAYLFMVLDGVANL